MAHPHHEHKAHRVEKRRVAHLTKHYAAGGAVHEDEAADKKLIKRTVKKTALKVEGHEPKHRADRPHRARGGKVKGKKGTTVNIINSPGHAMGGAPGMMPGAGLGMPPRPPMAAVPPAGAPAGAPAMPPGGMPAGAPPVAARPPIMPPQGMMPPRNKGGRAYAKGGAVKDGPAWKEGVHNGTQPQNSPGKNDTKDIGRGRVVTFWAGGKVESPKGVAKATKLPGGSGGGEARLAKERRAERDYARAK